MAHTVIAIDGGDAVGKSSLADSVVEFCRERQVSCRVVRRDRAAVSAITDVIETYDGELVADAEISLRLARDFCRAQLARQAPEEVVVLDRFVLSTASVILAAGIPLEDYRSTLIRAVQHCELEATILVSSPFELAWQRLIARTACGVPLSAKERRGKDYNRALTVFIDELLADEQLAKRQFRVMNDLDIGTAQYQLRQILSVVL